MHLEQPNPLTPGLVLVVIVAVANAACMERGCYQRFELADLDPLLRASAPAARATSLVLIYDEDYTNLFGAKSPLDPANVLKLVRAVCDFNPALVGVDLLTTSEWSAQNRLDAMSTLSGCPIVWVRDALLNVAGDVDAASASARFILGGVLGNEGPPEVTNKDSPGVCAALPVFETDADGLVRVYRTHALASIRGNSHSQPYTTFVWAMASPNPSAPRCGFEGGVGSSSIDRRKKIRFFDRSSLRRLPATQVLNAAEHRGRLFNIMQQQVLKPGSRVVVGGAFRHARDRYATPIGSLDGAELLAHAIETEGHQIREVEWPYSLLADIGLGSALLWGLNRLRLRMLWETILSSVLAGLAALFVCWALFSYYGYFLGVFGSFAGIILGAAVGAAWEPAWKEAGEFWRRLQQVFARTPDEPPAAG